MFTERAIRLQCAGAPLVGIAHSPSGTSRIGVLIIVGGPQYRVGSHRQFVLLSRYLAQQGLAAFRFDYRGIGDGVGPARNFLAIDDDIKAAIDAFGRECPGLEEIYLWGLCDAASAALLYAYRDERIAGIVLCNPWVRTEATFSKAIVKDYYRKQIFSSTFWRRFVNGKLDVGKSLSSFTAHLRTSFARASNAERPDTPAATSEHEFPARMLSGLKLFKGRVLLILSGNDLTAAEFDNLIREDREWADALRKKRAVVRRLPAANHTFSTRAWRDQVGLWTAEWIRNSSLE